MDMRMLLSNVERIKKLQDEAHVNSLKAIIYGVPKIGKSTIIATCPRPILVHSFDPGGTKVLSELIESGDVIADTRFEVENPLSPKAFQRWTKEMNDLETSKLFNHIGTYVLDSFTTWSQCIMYHVIKGAADKSNGKRKAGETPQQRDWLSQMNEIEIWMRRLTSLPCHVLAMGHEDVPKDEDGNQIGDKRPMITGKLAMRVPALFDEVYHLALKDQVKGTRMLQTQMGNRIHAGTRIGRNGKFNQFEEPDIRALIKKAGLNADDLPKLTETTTE